MGYVLSFYLLQPFTPPAEQSHIKTNRMALKHFSTRNTGEREKGNTSGKEKHTSGKEKHTRSKCYDDYKVGRWELSQELILRLEIGDRGSSTTKHRVLSQKSIFY